MSIEACIVNWAKSDFLEELYVVVGKELVGSLSIIEEWCDGSQRDAVADGPAGTGWGFSEGREPIIGYWGSGWDGRYMRDEVEDEDEDIIEYGDEDKDKHTPKLL